MPTQVETITIRGGSKETIPVRVRYTNHESVTVSGTSVFIDSTKATYVYTFPEPFAGVYPFDMTIYYDGSANPFLGIVDAAALDAVFVLLGFTVIAPFTYQVDDSVLVWQQVEFTDGFTTESYNPVVSNSIPWGDFSLFEEGGWLYLEGTSEMREIKFVNKHEFDVVANPPRALSIDTPLSSDGTLLFFSYVPRSHYKKITVNPGALRMNVVIDRNVIPFSTTDIPFVEYGDTEKGPAHHPVGPIQIRTSGGEDCTVITVA